MDGILQPLDLSTEGVAKFAIKKLDAGAQASTLELYYPPAIPVAKEIQVYYIPPVADCVVGASVKLKCNFVLSALIHFFILNGETKFFFFFVKLEATMRYELFK